MATTTRGITASVHTQAAPQCAPPVATTPVPTLGMQPIPNLKDFRSVLAAQESELRVYLPDGYDVKRLIRQAIQAYTMNPALSQVSGLSLIRAISKAGILDLDPTGINGEAWLAPFNDRYMPEGVLNCVLLVGYKGRIKAAYQEPRIVAVSAGTVRQGDHFGFDLAAGTLNHSWQLNTPRGEIVGAWARVDLRVGDTDKTISKIEVMDLNDLNKIRSNSPQPNGDAWTKWPEEMHRRAPFNRLFKYLPKSDHMKLIDEEDAMYDGYTSAPAEPANTGKAGPPPNSGAENLAHRIATK